MAGQPKDNRKRIERQEEKIFQLTDELEQAKEEYEILQQELQKQEKKELLDAYDKSSRDFTEVITFLRNKADI